MKWPISITVVRHAQSAYNELKAKRDQDPEYQAFLEAFNQDFESSRTKNRAKKMLDRYGLGVSDYETQLTEEGHQQAQQTGSNLAQNIPKPDVVLVSPYLRTRETLVDIRKGGFDIGDARIISDDRMREQEHGLALLYNDRRVFQVFHPEQKHLHDLLGPYWYQYPQGESVSQVRDRIRSITSTIIREFDGLNVLVVTHHLTILSIRANFEDLTPEDFVELDKVEKPINCGVTFYKGNPTAGSDGKLELDFYNKRLW